jgi:hypothetical protein
MPTLEERVRKLESRLGSGAALGLHSDASGLQDEVERLKVELGRLRTGQHSGNVFGGMIRTEIGPGFSYIGPFLRDLDATFPLDFTLPVPDYMLRISTCVLKLKPLPVRSSVTVAEAISAQTSEDGGAQTSGASSSASSGSQTTPSGGGSTSGASSDNTSSNESHLHVTDEDVSQTTTEIPSGGNHVHGLTHDHPVDQSGGHIHELPHTHPTPNHTHPTHSHGIAHTHDVIDHRHAVAGHGHDLTLAIAEGGSASQLAILIDGVDRTTALGGPWDDEVEIDVRQYLINARQEPVVGTHTFEVQSDTVGAVEVTGHIYCVLRPPS